MVNFPTELHSLYDLRTRGHPTLAGGGGGRRECVVALERAAICRVHEGDSESVGERGTAIQVSNRPGILTIAAGSTNTAGSTDNAGRVDRRAGRRLRAAMNAGARHKGPGSACVGRAQVRPNHLWENACSMCWSNKCNLQYCDLY